MSIFTEILAANPQSQDGRWIVGVIVIVIWVVSAIANGAKKKQEEFRRKQIREQLSGGPISAPPELPANLAPQIQMRVPRERAKSVAPVPAPRRAMPMRQPVARSSSTPAPPPIPVRPSIEAASSAMTHMATPISQTQTSTARTQTVSVNATALHKWLTPQTLRQQFFVTEILQPPVALRQNWLR